MATCKLPLHRLFSINNMSADPRQDLIEQIMEQVSYCAF